MNTTTTTETADDNSPLRFPKNPLLHDHWRYKIWSKVEKTLSDLCTALNAVPTRSMQAVYLNGYARSPDSGRALASLHPEFHVLELETTVISWMVRFHYRRAVISKAALGHPRCPDDVLERFLELEDTVTNHALVMNALVLMTAAVERVNERPHLWPHPAVTQLALAGHRVAARSPACDPSVRALLAIGG